MSVNRSMEATPAIFISWYPSGYQCQSYSVGVKLRQDYLLEELELTANFNNVNHQLHCRFRM